MTTANATKKLQITKRARIEVPSDHQENGIVAFQLVEIAYSFYGKVMKEVFDTKIMSDGRQLVIDGNGFIKAGHVI
jgi:hypothetical protein